MLNFVHLVSIMEKHIAESVHNIWSMIMFLFHFTNLQVVNILLVLYGIFMSVYSVLMIESRKFVNALEGIGWWLEIYVLLLLECQPSYGKEKVESVESTSEGYTQV